MRRELFDRNIIFRGDSRLRLRRATWFWRRRERVWEVTFDRWLTVSTAIHRRFTVALVKAVWGVYFPQRQRGLIEVEEEE